MEDYTYPTTTARVVKSRRKTIKAVMNEMALPDQCVWPDCGVSPWVQLGLPLCELHAARTHLALSDVLPDSQRDKRGINIHERGENWRTKPGVVYFAKSGDLIKIGFSTNPRERMKSLRSERMGTEFELLTTHLGTPDDERRTLLRFGEYWVRGEYYSKGPRLMEHIAHVKATGTGLDNPPD